jgi:ParB-like nuclease domain
MKIQTVGIDTVHSDPANVRKHPERNLEVIKASLARFGQQKPIVVDANGIVRAGNGTLEAAKALGWEKIGIVRTDLVNSEATAFSIADNRSAELAEWDEPGLAETLRSLEAEDFDLDVVGFTSDDVDELLERLANDQSDGDVTDEAEPENKGTGLALISQVTIEEPKTQVAPGDVFNMGPHVLLCCDVLNDWPTWVPYLKEGSLFCPYPSPFLPLATSETAFVLVQPDPYLCAVMIDFFNAAGALQ